MCWLLVWCLAAQSLAMPKKILSHLADIFGKPTYYVKWEIQEIRNLNICMPFLCFQRCGCKTGFRLQSDGLTCNDIDECTEIQPDVCSHNCLNTLGSYLCQCHPEYILEPDGQSCKTSGIRLQQLALTRNHLFCIILQAVVFLFSFCVYIHIQLIS